jgi:hypothetical protein
MCTHLYSPSEHKNSCIWAVKRKKSDTRFEVFTVVKIQVKVFWVVMLWMEEARSSKMSVSYRSTTWHHSAEDHDWKEGGIY